MHRFLIPEKIRMGSHYEDKKNDNIYFGR